MKNKLLQLALTHYHKMTQFDALYKYSSKKHCEKLEIACNKQFLYFSRFLPYMALISSPEHGVLSELL